MGHLADATKPRAETLCVDTCRRYGDGRGGDIPADGARVPCLLVDLLILLQVVLVLGHLPCSRAQRLSVLAWDSFSRTKSTRVDFSDFVWRFGGALQTTFTADHPGGYTAATEKPAQPEHVYASMARLH